MAMHQRLLYILYQLLLIFIRLTVLQTRRNVSLWPKCWLVPVILVQSLMSACLSLCRSSLAWCLPCPLCLHLDINALCYVPRRCSLSRPIYGWVKWSPDLAARSRAVYTWVMFSCPGIFYQFNSVDLNTARDTVLNSSR